MPPMMMMLLLPKLKVQLGGVLYHAVSLVEVMLAVAAAVVALDEFV